MDFIGHGIQSIGNEAVLTGLIIDFEDIDYNINKWYNFLVIGIKMKILEEKGLGWF
ncbi:hypothetical protein [Bacillus sp. S74]|uniref:hypothetical protein n=1 Tax=Bacillus sp. S74 TaxID=1317225 RepID=UPI00190C1C9B|nr:hypothetical protein [Bacillus sp. S74]MBK0148860.1 hypothetical protein [Bacillus sp. S74]